jgi:nucleotide-binding universal stress UspA family protein
MKNILVPCDFSTPAEEAFKFAVKIASQSNGEVHVLHVIDITFLGGKPTLANSYTFSVNFLDDIEKEVDQKFQIMWGKYAPSTMKIKFKHVISSLTQEIETYTSAHDIDLVIMGTHGTGNATVGSNTEKIVRNSKVPVVTIRVAPDHIKNIVFPILPYQVSDKFIGQVKKVQEFFQAKLHLLYINTPVFFKSDPDSNKELTQFALAKKISNCTLNIRSDYSIEGGVAHFVREIDADMIAMGTHGWKGLTHFIIGSTAEDIVNHIKMPIWTLQLE